MPPINDPTSVEQKAPNAEGRKTKSPPPEQPAVADLLALTIDAANGRIMTLERVDTSGARRELSADERVQLAKAQAGTQLARLVEQAFEAGIECVLGEGIEEDPAESKADGALSRLLLQSLIERSKAKHLVESENLDRVIVGTLIGQAATAASGATH